MSSYGEDIIRETFEKFGDAIGVQMQMPDDMIANLGAVLQAQIDLLAELQSTGRLIPTGGMALTAEQVEDLRYDGWVGADMYMAMRKVGITEETAEAAMDYMKALGLVARRKGVRITPADWPNPTPAEPAEEETKAEAFDVNALVDQVTQAAWNERKRTKEFYGYDSQDWDELPSSKQQIEYSTIRGALTELQRLGLLMLPAASSPVVPAPTETGPWETLAKVPASVPKVIDTVGREFWRGPHGWKPYYFNSGESHHAFAPFVAAEKG